MQTFLSEQKLQMLSMDTSQKFDVEVLFQIMHLKDKAQVEPTNKKQADMKQNEKIALNVNQSGSMLIQRPKSTLMRKSFKLD